MRPLCLLDRTIAHADRCRLVLQALSASGGGEAGSAGDVHRLQVFLGTGPSAASHGELVMSLREA